LRAAQLLRQECGLPYKYFGDFAREFLAHVS
jgi:hypothetical protein